MWYQLRRAACCAYNDCARPDSQKRRTEGSRPWSYCFYIKIEASRTNFLRHGSRSSFPLDSCPLCSQLPSTMYSYTRMHTQQVSPVKIGSARPTQEGLVTQRVGGRPTKKADAAVLQHTPHAVNTWMTAATRCKSLSCVATTAGAPRELWEHPRPGTKGERTQSIAATHYIFSGPTIRNKQDPQRN